MLVAGGGFDVMCRLCWLALVYLSAFLDSCTIISLRSVHGHPCWHCSGFRFCLQQLAFGIPLMSVFVRKVSDHRIVSALATDWLVIQSTAMSSKASLKIQPHGRQA